MVRQAHRLLVLASLVLVLALGALGTACGGTGQRGNKSVSKSAVLVLKCNIEDAEVWINSRYSRSAGELARGLRLAPGSYRIEVRYSGHHSRYFDLDLDARERRDLDVVLAQRFN